MTPSHPPPQAPGSLPAAVEQALAAGAPPQQVTGAAELLSALAEKGFGGDREAFAATQRALYALQFREDRQSFPVRRYLASEVSRVWEKHIPPAKNVPALADLAAAFRLGPEQTSMQLRHPLQRHFLEGNPTESDMKIYLRHHWHRARGFYELLIEMAQGMPLEQGSIVYENLYDEGGRDDPKKAHTFLFRPLAEHFGFPCELAEPCPHTAGLTYLNNRRRSAWYGNVAWALGILYSIELRAADALGTFYQLLRKMGVPDAKLEYHRIHMGVDEKHAAELLTITTQLVRSEEDHRTFWRAVQYHAQLAGQYYDAILEEIRAAR